jgi:hypothetical protein
VTRRRFPVAAFGSGHRALLGNPFLFFKADQIGGIVDGARLPLWQNQGNERNALQPNPNRQPIYRATLGPGGRAAVEYVAGTPPNTDYMDVDFSGDAGKAQPVVCGVVAYVNALGSVNTIFDVWNNPGTSIVCAVDTAGEVVLDAGSVLSSAAGAFPAATWVGLVYEVNGTASNLETSTGFSAAGDAGANVWDDARIGAMNNGMDPFVGRMACLGAWNDGTTTAQVRELLVTEFPSVVWP